MAWPVLRRASDAELHRHPHYAELVKAGRRWVACADRLPHEDDCGVLHYLVLTPGCDGWLQCCRYVGGRWYWREGAWQYTQGRWKIGENGYIGDATHWRLAAEGEHVSRAATPGERRTLRRLPGHVPHW